VISLGKNLLVSCDKTLHPDQDLPVMDKQTSGYLLQSGQSNNTDQQYINGISVGGNGAQNMSRLYSFTPQFLSCLSMIYILPVYKLQKANIVLFTLPCLFYVMFDIHKGVLIVLADAILKVEHKIRDFCVSFTI
jgi:hypothetical protein